MVTLLDILLVCVVIASFFFGLRAGVVALIVLRPLSDRLFNLGGFDVAGQHVTFGVVLNIIVIVALLVNALRIRNFAPAKLRYIWLPFLLVCTVAVLYSPLQIEAERKLLLYVSYYAIFVLAFLVARSERDVAFFLKMVVLSSLVPVAYGLLQLVTGADWFDDRIQSTFSHPNMLAFYLVAIIGVILFLSASQRSHLTGGRRLVLNLYLIPIFVVLLTTQTRSAWIGALLLIVVYGIVRDRWVLLVTVVGAAIALTIPTVSDRIMNLAANNDYIGGPAVTLNSYAWRELLWRSAFVYIWEQPLFGHGLHSFVYYSKIFFTPTPDGTYAHNDYIQILFESGLVGLLAYLWIFWRCFGWFVRRWRVDGKGVLMAGAILVSYLICSYSDNLLEYLPFQWEFWFPLGLMCAQMGRQFAGTPRQLTRLVGQPRWIAVAPSFGRGAQSQAREVGDYN